MLKRILPNKKQNNKSNNEKIFFLFWTNCLQLLLIFLWYVWCSGILVNQKDVYPEISILHPPKFFYISQKIFCIPKNFFYIFKKVFCIVNKVSFVSQEEFFGEISHVSNGIIFYVCSTLFQFYILFWRRVKKNATRFRWRKGHSKVKTNDESYCKGSLNSVIFCIRKPGEEKLWSPWSAEAEEDDRTEQRIVSSDANHESVHHHKLLKARIQHAIQCGTMTNLGLLKNERCRPWLWTLRRCWGKPSLVLLLLFVQLAVARPACCCLCGLLLLVLFLFLLALLRFFCCLSHFCCPFWVADRWNHPCHSGPFKMSRTILQLILSTGIFCCCCLCCFAAVVCAIVFHVCVALAASFAAFAAFADPFDASSCVAAVWCSLLFVLLSCHVCFSALCCFCGSFFGSPTIEPHWPLLTFAMS